MSAIRDVIIFLEKNPNSDFSFITEGTGLSNGAVSSQLNYLQQLGCLIITGTRKRYRYSIPPARQYGKTKSPHFKSPTALVKPPINTRARKNEIVALIERGLRLRAQTAISQLIADSGDQDTVNWALDKNAACGVKTKYF